VSVICWLVTILQRNGGTIKGNVRYICVDTAYAPKALCRCGSERVEGTLNACSQFRTGSESKGEISVVV
jgi:hypothetical protein